MKKWFFQLPIRFKLYGIVLATCFIALFLAAAASFLIQKQLIASQLRDEIQTLADVISENSRAGLVFEDQKALTDILRSLHAKKSITQAWLFTTRGEIVATYRSRGGDTDIFQLKEDPSSFTGMRFLGGHAGLVQPIHLDREEIGRLFIEVDLREMRDNTIAVAALMGGVLLFGLCLAMLFSSRLLQSVIAPITNLSELTRIISEEKNYQARASVQGDDELARLAAGFNEMIEQIEKRDSYLEDQVAERTRDLELQALDLHEAKDRAEAANRAKSQFLANMSHEIRTPMNAILGMTHLAIQADGPEQQRFLATVRTSANNLLGILNDILDFSKIEAGQMQFDLRPFHLRQLLENIISTLNVTAVEKGLRLDVSTAEDLPTYFVGDDLRLHQILLNLVGNAIKFTPRGGVTITVEPAAEQQVAGKTGVHFQVIDTGIGIAREKIEEVFHSFQQADSSYSRQYGGTGLGLTISRQLTALMDGRMWAESEIGCGSTFHCIVYLAAADDQAVPADQSEVPAQAVRGLTILVVDDNEVNRDVARMILENDHAVTTAANGLAALEALVVQSFDVILMDVQMPVMDGLATTAVIRAVEQGLPLPQELPTELADALNHKLSSGHVEIVAMTAHAMGGDREMCLAAGMDNYVTKPFKPEQLNTLFQTMLAANPALGRNHDPRPLQPGDESFSDGKSLATGGGTDRLLAHLQATTNLNPEQSQRVLAAVLTSVTSNLTLATTALDQGDLTCLGRAAHTLKGTLLQCGLQDLAEKAEKIHHCTRTDGEVDYADLLNGLQAGLTAHGLAENQGKDTPGGSAR
jgi:signal transduction histidine kinase/DNA-binding response OmpR family regulator